MGEKGEREMGERGGGGYVPTSGEELLLVVKSDRRRAESCSCVFSRLTHTHITMTTTTASSPASPRATAATGIQTPTPSVELPRQQGHHSNGMHNVYLCAVSQTTSKRYRN